MTSPSSNGIHTEFLQFSMPRGLYLYVGGSNERQAKIYLGAVRTVDMGRPDGQLCDKIFQKFIREIFPV
jgi:hypothetical protein